MPRKLWSTTREPEAPAIVEMYRRRHESRAEAYRYVENDSRNFAASGGQGMSVTVVWVDERDGKGWQLYEKVEHQPEPEG